MYFDAHLHLINEQELIQAYQKNIKGFILNATKEDDWEKIISLSKKHPFIYGAIGIHPWFIDSISHNWEKEMELYLKNNPSLMIGEIGLDGLKKDIKKQEEIFLKSLYLAKKYQRIVHIHSVKSWDKMLPILQNFSDLTFLFHRFNAPKEIIQELKKYNAWFSVNSKKNIELLPTNKVLSETDCDSMDYNADKLISLVDNFKLSAQQIEENFYDFIKNLGEINDSK